MKLSDTIKFDRYNRKARLYPALLAFFPIFIFIYGILPEMQPIWYTLLLIFSFCGGFYLFIHIGREKGKKLEGYLFEKWGGKPTSHILSHIKNENKPKVELLHLKLSGFNKDLDLPSEQEEIEAPEESLHKYEIATDFLREQTRDKEKFSLIFEENCNYGFRRNLLGLKKIGIISNASIFLITTSLISFESYLYEYLNLGEVAYLYVVLLISLVSLFTWIFLINEEWVKTNAFAYAKALMNSVHKI